MKAKALLYASVATLALAGMAPLAAQAAPVSGGEGQDLPKPTTASDQNANPAAPQPSVQESPTEDEAIVVTGLRRSLESAQAVKRNSDGIVDAIVAEDIGKLPDTFASSALARVSGVQVNRGGGESAGVTVRGLPDISTTYNGREIFTAEGRFVQIQDFPAGTVAALEVYKSGTANLIEGGIGGQVNVRGRRPFDFDGFEISGSLNGVNWEQSGKLSWNGNLLVSDRWDTGIGEMGLLVNASYVGINFLDSTREQSLVIGTTSPTSAPGTTGGVRFPDAQGMFLGYGDRFRPSVNAAFQWKPTPELEIYVDGLFQGYRGEDTNRWLFVPIFGDIRLSNLVTRPGNANLAESATVSNAAAPDGYYGAAKGKTDTYQVGGGAVWKRGGLQISGDVAFTDSKYTFDLVNIDYAFASSPVRNVSFNAAEDGGASFNFLNFDATNPANFLSRGLYQQYLQVSGKDMQARADLSYDFAEGFLKRLQFGVRYNDRDAGRTFGDSYVNNLGAQLPLSRLPVSFSTGLPGFKNTSSQPVRTYTFIPQESIRENLPALRQFFGQPASLPADNPTEAFNGNEKALAVYGQLKYGVDIGDMTLDGLVGLRAVRTQTEISGFLRQPDGSIAPTTQDNEYWDYLPNVSARLAFSPEVQLRLAYTETRTRPGFFSLRPALTINQPAGNQSPITLTDGTTTTNYRTANGGNPDLTPLTSQNYDASLEWYFSRSGSLTGAIFRRDATGFIFNDFRNVPDPIYNALRIDQPLNSGRTRFQGAEISFTTFLDFEGLPDWAKGFGVQANGTYIDSKGDLSPRFNTLLDNEQVPFNGVSKWTYNLVALYERPFFSARLAYNYRSDFVVNYTEEAFDVGPSYTVAGQNDPRIRGITERGRGQLDFSTTLTPLPNVTLAFDIVNVLGNPLQRYRQFNDTGEAFERQTIYLERTYSLGVRFRF
ncbi:TonB-dependent receptor [Sphingomonas sp. M1-B02]|uniref:TonB-dependent receptor n=1 Tax=Sphingomonas sp. M1-B02 TaxID=3114300 RepID=UPI00223E8F36|nr:TonB-dependent receptor [Sphingomonas sp. S6-11]UZK67666.1 TonB-dependent receptor [Sphingomonas sp. S6-11]